MKPHGALYNRTVHDEGQARAVVAGVRLAGGALPVLGLPGSRLLTAAAEAGLTGVPEAFADRAYTAEGSLVPRSEAGSVVTDEDAVVRRALAFAVEGSVEAADGTAVAVAARSLCVHGDTPNAARIAARVREALETAGVGIGAFA